jgi:hypothetical protein
MKAAVILPKAKPYFILQATTSHDTNFWKHTRVMLAIPANGEEGLSLWLRHCLHVVTNGPLEPCLQHATDKMLIAPEATA